MEQPSSPPRESPPSPPAAPTPAAPTPSPPPLVVNRDCVCCCDGLIVQNGRNFERSGPPYRIMFFRRNFWEDFNGEAVESMRSGFLEGKAVVPLEIEGVKYAIDFARMVQVHLGCGEQRSIAWIDNKNTPFFPKQFLHHDFSENAQPVITDRKGKGKMVSEEGHFSGPLKRLRLTPTSKFPNAKLLSKNDKTYAYFSSLFLNNMAKFDNGAVITDIHEFQISEPLARARWLVLEKEIETTRRVRGDANVVFGWYAATKETVASIFSHGFSLPRISFGLPLSIRAGMCLADLESPNYSATQCQVDKDGEKHLILCRVVLGSVEKMELEFNLTGPCREEYDTGSNDPCDPKWYMVWNNDINRRILPMCVVSCKTSAVEPVRWNEYSYEFPAGFPKLILELKKCIPLSRVGALGNLYNSFKTRREMVRSTFMKHLQDITGEELLFKVAKEVFGR
ncbi:probable inactive poly [ADP-ribose] polymerase SRO3 [Gastrolobium bilobum]|uniref:probable inactive poly [ADP-ribose] polymerase SRO3 n=1 Tax=Gastrolobium bilobum TaxID=150636 RepID=UPI002AB0888B|nr:probable inactive poly [ADP-ribose] polymerase SRO3 [Gastrolobium bilobum]